MQNEASTIRHVSNSCVAPLKRAYTYDLYEIDTIKHFQSDQECDHRTPLVRTTVPADFSWNSCSLGDENEIPQILAYQSD